MKESIPWQLYSIVAAFPLLVVLVFSPPRSRSTYLVYSLLFGVLATFLVIAYFHVDFNIRSHLLPTDHTGDLAAGNASQIAVVVTAMLIGGVSTNLVAGLSLPWVDRSSEERLNALRRESAKRTLKILYEGLIDQLRVVPDHMRTHQVASLIQKEIFHELLHDLACDEDESAEIARFRALELPPGRSR